MGTIFLLALIGSAVAVVILRRGEALRFETQAAPSQAVMAATASIATSRRWSVTHQTDNAVTFVYAKRPSKLIAFFLLWFFLLPGIVYLVLAGKKEVLTLQLDRSTGTTVVQLTSNGFRGKSAGRGIRSQIGVMTGTTAQANALPAARELPADLQTNQALGATGREPAGEAV